MKPLHPSTVAASRQSAANLRTLKNAAFCRKPLRIVCGLAMAVALQLGMLAGSAQTNIYLFSGSKTNITLPPGTYIITAYGAPGGGYDYNPFRRSNLEAGVGAEMSAEFNFSASTTLTLLVGGGGGGGSFTEINNYNAGGGGGGGGSFVVESSTPLVIAGGGGGAAGDTYGAGDGSISTNGGNGSYAGDS